MILTSKKGYTDVLGCGDMNLAVTLDCGQAFRWQRDMDGSWFGVVKGVETTIAPIDGGFRFSASEEDFRRVLYDYFDFGRDYGKVVSQIKRDENLLPAALTYGTIRILRQDPWEALCSFIFSACNNIPRIKGIIERFCESFGERLSRSYAFPTPEAVAALSLEDLEVLRAGYRTPYILDAARKVASGEIDLQGLYSCSVAQGEAELMKIKGVGKKVADCVLLFGLCHTEAFPIDRHIKRFCQSRYPGGLPEYFSGIEGIAQQYMFQLQRTGDAEDFGIIK